MVYSRKQLICEFLNLLSKNNEKTIAIISIDIDHFRLINHSLGHEAGEQLIQKVSERFLSCLSPNQTLGHVCEGRFILIQENISSEQHCEQIIRILGHYLNHRSIVVEGQELHIGANYGVAFSEPGIVDVTTLFDNADQALHLAKEKGRNSIVFYRDKMKLKLIHDLLVENDLYQALKNEEFILYYQPYLDLEQKKITGVEALIRWNHPAMGLIYPDNFLPVANSTELIIPIGEWVLKTACAQLKNWLHDGMESLHMSINLSSQQLKDSHTANILSEIIQSSNVPTDLIELELTETNTFEDNIDIINNLNMLKKLGISMAIDDFGIGYSNLNYLNIFPIQKIKVDRSFVQSIGSNKPDILSAILDLGMKLNLRTLAEGIETLEQISFLCEKNCHEIQGNLLSPPLPSNEFIHFMKSKNEIVDAIFQQNDCLRKRLEIKRTE